MTATVFPPIAVKYMLKVAVPALLAEEVLPTTLVLESVVVQLPVYGLLSSPFNVAVIVSEKFTEGLASDVEIVIEYT